MNPPSQTARLYALLRDGRPHRTDEIAEKVYGNAHAGLARVGARVNDLAAGKWSGRFKCTFVDEWGNVIGTVKGQPKGWHDHFKPELYWYRIGRPREAAPVLPPAFEPKEKVEATNNQSLF